MSRITFLSPGKVDAVLHFASPASPNPQSPSGYFNLPIQTMKAGALGTHNCLGVARANKARFLLASTSEIYGDPLVHPQTESYAGNVDPVGPRAVYDEAKRFAESLTMAYHRAHGVDTRIVRIFNTYGPRMDLEDGRALPNLLKQALLGQPLTVYGDGSQTRSFCYVDDLIDGIVKLLYSDEHLPVNIGNQHEMTILQFAETINRDRRQQGRHHIRQRRAQCPRPAAAPARYHPRPRDPQLGTKNFSRRGHSQDNSIFQAKTGACNDFDRKQRTNPFFEICHCRRTRRCDRFRGDELDDTFIRHETGVRRDHFIYLCGHQQLHVEPLLDLSGLALASLPASIGHVLSCERGGHRLSHSNPALCGTFHGARI